MLPVEFLIGEMLWCQEMSEAKHSDPEKLWSREHITGSCAEGLCIPRSLLHKSDNNFSDLKLKMEGSLKEFPMIDADLDIMLAKEAFDEKGDEEIPIFDVIRSENNPDPRYVFLRLTEQWKKLNPDFSDSVHLPHSFLMPESAQNALEKDVVQDILHGPARKFFMLAEQNGSLDKTVVFKYTDAWPVSAMDWLTRPRKSGWPSPALVQEIFDTGCHLAPVGSGKRTCEPVKSEQSKQAHETTMDEREWRISFSLAENKLGQSLSPVQRHIMVLLKVIKKAYLSDHDVISTYNLKNVFFWECENRENEFWREDNSVECLLSLLDRLVECLKKRHLSHYIMPDSNLMAGDDPVKLDEAVKTVLEVREDIFHKTVNLLTRLQSMMFQSKDFVSDFNDTKVKSTNEETNNLINSLCQLYKKVIVDEQSSRNNANAMIGEFTRSISESCASLLGILEEYFSESTFLPSTVSILDFISFVSFYAKYKDAVDNEMTKISHAFKPLENACESQLSSILNVHLIYLLQNVLSVVQDLYGKVIASPHFIKILECFSDDSPSDSQDKVRLIVGLLPIIQKHKNKILGYMKDLVIQLPNIFKVTFSSISPLRLRVHESLLARSYCRL